MAPASVGPVRSGMTLHSPLLPAHLARGGTTLTYPDPGDPTRSAEVVEAFGPIELEYAAVRRGCALFDLPQRATILVRGSDRLEFLGRMLTQEVKALAPWTICRSFWLNRKGRIDADLRVTALEDHIRFDLDVHAARRTMETLGGYLFAEDVELTDASETHHRIALHGPGAIRALASVGEPAAGPGLDDLGDRRACLVRIAGHEVVVERDDLVGEIGLHLTCETAGVGWVYEALLATGGQTLEAVGAGEADARARVRPAGWHAFNIARIEAGTPLYPIDFGPENLPHETGVLYDRVSFKKGCYLGQEIVARMESRGHSKPVLVALRFDGDADPSLPQAVSGDPVLSRNADPEEKPLGHITSSTISPMLGSVPICFARVRAMQARPGSTVSVLAEGSRIAATVQEGLAFWTRGGA